MPSMKAARWRSTAPLTKSCLTDLALRWALQPPSAQAATWASRLGVVQRFAVWLRASDRRTEVPPAGLLPCRYRRKVRPAGPGPAVGWDPDGSARVRTHRPAARRRRPGRRGTPALRGQG